MNNFIDLLDEQNREIIYADEEKTIEIMTAPFAFCYFLSAKSIMIDNIIFRQTINEILSFLVQKKNWVIPKGVQLFSSNNIAILSPFLDFTVSNDFLFTKGIFSELKEINSREEGAKICEVFNEDKINTYAALFSTRRENIDGYVVQKNENSIHIALYHIKTLSFC